MWDPHSYVSEVVGAARHRNACLFTSPHETVFEKQQHSRTLLDWLKEMHSGWSVHTFADEGEFELHVYTQKDASLPANFDSFLKHCISSSWRSIVNQSPEYLGFFEARRSNSDESRASVKRVVDQCFVMSALVHLCSNHEVTAIVLELPSITAVLPGATWTTGVKGIPFHCDDEEILTRTCSVGPNEFAGAEASSFFINAALGYANSIDTSRARYMVSFVGDNILSLLSVLTEFDEASENDVSEFIMQIANDPRVDNFFCVCDDGAETCRDAALELREAKRTGTAQVWNAQAHAEKCVRIGNTADAMHLLEGLQSHSSISALQDHLIRNLVHAVPVAHTVFSLCASNGDVVSQLLGSFQILDSSEQVGCVSVPRCSPLFNYFSSWTTSSGPGISLVFLKNEDDNQFQSSGTTQWNKVSETVVVKQENHVFHILQSLAPTTLATAHSFSVSHACEIGDCVVFFGAVNRLLDSCQSPIVLLQGTVNVDVTSGATLVTPILCTMMHRLYGQIGIMSTALTVCSNFPPCILLNIPQSGGGNIMDEQYIDPNVTLHTFNPSTTLFDGRAYSSVINDLPFPMVQLAEAARGGDFQQEVNCRLIRVEPYGARPKFICILAVTGVKGPSDPCKTLVYLKEPS